MLWLKDIQSIIGKVCRQQLTDTRYKKKGRLWFTDQSWLCYMNVGQIWPSVSDREDKNLMSFTKIFCQNGTWTCHTQHPLEAPWSRLLSATFIALCWLLLGINKQKKCSPLFLFMVGKQKWHFICMLTAYKHSTKFLEEIPVLKIYNQRIHLYINHYDKMLLLRAIF